MTKEELARALEALAAKVTSSPRSVVGMSVSAVAGPGSTGDVTGLNVTATGGQGSGNVTGLHVQAGVGEDPASGLVKELREAAVATREGKAHRSWLESLVQRVRSLKDRVVDTVAVATVQQGIAALFS